jgi:hypothetical protein
VTRGETRGCERIRGRVGGSLLAATLLAAGAPAAADCPAPWVALGAGVEKSRWEETGSQGRRLVEESGTLRGASVSLGARCGGFDGLVRVAQAVGSRDYDGVTSANAPLRTRSDIGQFGVDFRGFVPLATHWSAAGRAVLRRIDREIASVGRVQGYRERFSNAELAAGARVATEPGAALSGSVVAWLGVGPPGRMELRLPGFDPAELRLGASRSLEFELQAGDARVAPGWHWQTRLGYRRERWQAGESRVLTRNGVPAAAAVQPTTLQSALRLQAELRLDF